MTAVHQTLRKGWCPGVRRPMATGDGLIVRIRPRCGRLLVSDAAALSMLAERYGNGLIDLTRRANVQLRGVTPESLAALSADLDALRLADGTVDAEAARNVVVGPLAGLDPGEAMDVRPIVDALEDELAREATALRLPGKFGFIVDGGGRLPLDGERADIRLRAVGRAEGADIAIGIDRPGGVRWLRLVAPDRAVAAVMGLVRAFARLDRTDGGARMMDVSEADIDEITTPLDELGRPASGLGFARAGSSTALGVIGSEGGPMAVGFAPPFGRVQAEDLLAIAEQARELGLTEFRISPWRSLYVPVADEASARALLKAAEAHGMITTPGDPLLAIDACPGAPACASAELDTRAAARVLAPLLAQLGCETAHVSGCGKGCARSKAADLVLVGDGARFGIVRHGTVHGQVVGSVSPPDLPSLPSLSHIF